MDPDELKQRLGIKEDGEYRINEETGVVEKEGFWGGWKATETRVDPESGNVQTEGFWGRWKDTNARIDKDSGVVQTEGFWRHSDTEVRVDPDTGVVQKKGFWGGWKDTEERIDPETGEYQRRGFWGGWKGSHSTSGTDGGSYTGGARVSRTTEESETIGKWLLALAVVLGGVLIAAAVGEVLVDRRHSARDAADALAAQRPNEARQRAQILGAARTPTREMGRFRGEWIYPMIARFPGSRNIEYEAIVTDVDLRGVIHEPDFRLARGKLQLLDEGRLEPVWFGHIRYFASSDESYCNATYYTCFETRVYGSYPETPGEFDVEFRSRAKRDRFHATLHAAVSAWRARYPSLSPAWGR